MHKILEVKQYLVKAKVRLYGWIVIGLFVGGWAVRARASYRVRVKPQS